ncbi:MAG TPA: AMP-dependent synthetase/ligase [Solirubrobacteraceae bacterium]|jgi:long-chain acyl-CoA synthetase|nr:AMP-dependent synthetase/ligase [Solirubrobacteraceae bacterium]
MEGTTATQAAGKRAIDAPTVAEAFRITTEQKPDDVAVRNRDDSISITWGEVRDRSDALAGGLAKLGVSKGDTVALMFGNRPEFHICDLAAMTLGAVPFSIYQTYTPEQIQYLISDSGARVAFVEQAYLDRMLEARKELPELEHVILVDGEAPEGVTPLADVEGSNADFDIESSWRAIKPEDLLTLIYTSGTTGPPKGVQLSHSNMMDVVASVEEIIGLPEGIRVISWLPSAHVAERNAHHYIPIVFAGTITCCENPREVMSYLPDVRPNWFFAVPRIWEKLKAGLETMLHSQPDEQREKVEQAIAAAREKVRLEQAGEEVPADLAEEVAAADEEYFAGLRKMLGLDDVITINVGAAPTPVEVLEFFHAIGLELAELYGMSESTGAGTCNRPGHVKIGTVGPAAPGCEVKLAEDGEVLIRGGCVMVGYRNQPDKTAETVDADGWLHTGDIGEIDDEGFLKIVDRKKELIINAAGKNMSPANIEAELKTATPLIGQAAAIGDARSFNTALIVLDADFAPGWAKKHGIEDTSLEALAADEKVRAAVQEGVDGANEHLARVEQIKKFTIVSGDWLPGGDELTPTMKLKRKPIAEKYSDEIEAMYEK